MSSVKPVPLNPAQPAVAAAENSSSPPSVLSAVEIARAARKRRAQRLLRNLALWVGVPTLLSVFYFGALARDQYESFSVLSVPATHGAILREFMLSRDMLAKLEQAAQFSRHYRMDDDALQGLPADAGSEQRYAYFLKKVEVRVEEAGIFRLKVRALSGKDAARFAQVMVGEVGTFLEAHRPDPSASVVVVSVPSQPNEPTYPNRFYSVLTVFLVSAAFYAIGALLVAAAREHAQF